MDGVKCEILVDDSTHAYGCDYDEYETIRMTYGPYQGQASYGPYSPFHGSVTHKDLCMKVEKEERYVNHIKTDKRAYYMTYKEVEYDDRFKQIVDVYKFFRDFIQEDQDDEKPMPPSIKTFN